MPGDECQGDLQRLAQSLLELGPISPADARSRAVFQYNFELAVRDRLELNDAVDVDDSGSMDANEVNGVQSSGQFIQSRTVEQLLTRNVQVHIDAGSLNPIDIHHPHKASCATGFHHQPIQSLIQGGSGGNQLSRRKDADDAIRLRGLRVGPRRERESAKWPCERLSYAEANPSATVQGPRRHRPGQRQPRPNILHRSSSGAAREKSGRHGVQSDIVAISHFVKHRSAMCRDSVLSSMVPGRMIIAVESNGCT